MLLLVLIHSLSLTAAGQQVPDDWIDPYDMLNYDASTKTMRKPTEPANYPNVPTKRREYIQDSSLQTACDGQVAKLQRQIAELKKKIDLISQQPTCAPVFKRFLSRLLKEIQRLGLPTDSTDVLYDAKIMLSRQSMTEIQTLLEGEESWRTGALDNAISQILVDLKQHDHEVWKWRFEDTFGVELDTLLKVLLCVLFIVAIISTQLWSTVSWFMQFSRLFAISFLISIVWTWCYQYKTAFAEHQKNIAKLDGISDKCSGMRKIDWSDSLKEWFRGTFTLQDDPCKKYYEVLLVNPLLLVPPTKAFSATIVTFITEPMKHIGEGIGDFIRALLKDLPITLQIPVFLTIVISIMLTIVVFVYGGIQAVFQHGIRAPFQRPQRDPSPPQLQRPHHLQMIEDYDHLGGGDAPQHAPRQRAIDGRLPRNIVHRRRPNRTREHPANVVVETLCTAEGPSSENETDSPLHETEQRLSDESHSDNKEETQEEPAGATACSVAADKVHLKTKRTKFSSETKPLKAKENPSKDKRSTSSKPERADRVPSQAAAAQDQPAPAEDRPSPRSCRHIETIGIPVQESSPASVE